ncbi:MAG: hypothetical protein H0V68_07690 [Actinobacteria bacterium]|nr:hypothetical protein [Actinomycetota bacterium]
MRRQHRASLSPEKYGLRYSRVDVALRAPPGDGWVIAGLLLFVAIFALGVGLIVPAGQKLATLAKSGAAATELAEAVHRLRMLSWIDVALLAVAIFLMTTKPF